MPCPRGADTGVVDLGFSRNPLHIFDDELNGPRVIEYALASASNNSRIGHAVLETEEKTLCGRAFDVELSDYRKPGDPGGEEPNCRVCRRALRRRADRLQGVFRRELPRMGCRYCGSSNFRHIVRRREVDRCFIRLDGDGKLHYDLDEAPRRQVESIEVTCLGCRRPVTENDLVRAIYAPRPDALGTRRGRRRVKTAS